MAGQAGWYPAPGEAGLVRYWSGTEWTEHRQPMPETAPSAVEKVTPAVDAVVAAPQVVPLTSEPEPVAEAPAVEPTRELSATELAMIEFERQFERQSAAEFAHANTQPSPTFAAEPTFAAPAAAPTASAPAPTSFAQAPAPSRFAPQPTVAPEPLRQPAPEAVADQVAAPSTVADMWTQVAAEEDAAVSTAPAVRPAPTSIATLLAEPETVTAAAPDTEEGWKPARAPSSASKKKTKKKMSGGAKTIIVGILVILVGAGVFGYLAYQAAPEAGEGSANGVVTDLGASTGSNGAANCAPVARFAVAGQSYTATTSVPVSACPVALGQTVTVIYDTKAPATSGRIQVPGPFALLVWLIPITGLIVFIVGVIAFMRSRSKAAPIS